MEKKAVITADSSANLFSAKDAEYVSVPLRIITDVKEYTDDEKLDVPGMLNDLKHYKGKSSTACPSVGLLDEWIGRGFCETPQQLAEMLREMMPASTQQTLMIEIKTREAR